MPVFVVPTPAATGPALLLHGGASDIPDRELADHRDGLAQAVEVGRRMLEAGASALDTVIEVVATMEAHGGFDAGRGSVLNADGDVELDASVVCGETGRWGAVAAMRRVMHPSRLARWLLETAPANARFLVGEGAERYAAQAGVERVEPLLLVHPREVARWEAQLVKSQRARAQGDGGAALPKGPHGTVGCVARDAEGRLAACTSTGGTPMKPAGRIGDTPIVGSGTYADRGVAISCTGDGEAIVWTCAAVRAADAVTSGQDVEAVIRARLDAIAALRNGSGAPFTAGLILLGSAGAGAFGFNTPRMARAGWHAGGETWHAV